MFSKVIEYRTQNKELDQAKIQAEESTKRHLREVGVWEQKNQDLIIKLEN